MSAFTLILGGAVRKYLDGREVCTKTPKGRAEYARRRLAMAQRQHWICCICQDPRRRMRLEEVTFEHENGRGMGGSWRDDRIEDEDGKPMNGAAHLFCNSKKGSKRV